MVRSASAAFLLAAALAAACSENQAGPFDEFVKLPSSQPTLVDPAPGAVGVSPHPTVRVVYQDKLDLDTVEAGVVELLDLGADLSQADPVAVSVAATHEQNGLLITPLSQLIAPRTYEVRVMGRTAGVRFVEGNLLDDFVFRFTTAQDPALTTASPLPDATNGVSYSQQLQVTGGAGALSFWIAEGTLPNGLRMDTRTGLIHGAPEGYGQDTSFRFSVSVMDAIGRIGTRTYTLEVTGG